MSAIPDKKKKPPHGTHDTDNLGGQGGLSMSPKLEYQISRWGGKFVVTDSDQEVVGIFETEDLAQREIVREQQDDAIWERTKQLMIGVVRTIMVEFSVDLETALHWVNSASGMTPLAMDDEP